MNEENQYGMNKKKLKLLVLGSGGREHTLAKICSQSPLVNEVIVAPGNGGMEKEFRAIALDLEDNQSILEVAKSENIDLVVVGPEVPLCNGVVDELNKVNILAYGPDKDCARLEGSKAFSKDFLARHDIPTAQYGNFSEIDAAITYLDSCSLPVVIKASGLAAGKGVIICQEREDAEREIRDMLSGESFGTSGREVVIEEFLEGEEASLHLICSGQDYVALPMSQDHKRVGENDTGPNTGGMGAYAPTSLVSSKMLEEYEESIVRPTLAGLQAEGMNFRGTLYIGLMLTSSGPKVLEFNVRFGDPETQVILPLVDQDLVPILFASAQGRTLPDKLKIKDEFAMVVVLASQGYPSTYPKGEIINPPAQLPPSTMLIHAGTKINTNGDVVTSGGRVMGAVALGKSLESAKDSAYGLCESVHFPSKYFRKDIGHREFSRN
jgi:phosphoribosylamine--glycine ligase